MEDNKGLIDRYTYLRDDLGIVIPCSHENENDTKNPKPGDDSCRSSVQKLEVILNFDYYETLIHYHTNGKRMLCMRKLPPKKGFLINPFCILCRVNIVTYLLASKNKNILIGHWLIETLDHISDKIWKGEVESLKRQGQHEEGLELEIDVVDNKIEVYGCRLFHIEPDRVCNEEEFEAWVDDEDDVVEEEIPVIKGLKRLSIHDDDDDNDSEFLKREDLCGICLQKLKTTDENEGNEDLKGATNGDGVSIVTKWSKSLTKLPCEHVFHEPCVLRWLYKKHVCPFCRNPVDE